MTLHHQRVLRAALAMLAVLLACVLTAAPARADGTVLTVTGTDGGQRALTMDELRALTPFQGSAGYLDVIGRVAGPYAVTGVRISDLVGLVAHDQGSPVTLLSTDGYSVTFSATRLAGGGVTVYSAKAPHARTKLAAGDSLVSMLAYAENGAALSIGDDGPGPLRFWYAWQSSGPGYLVDAGLCVRSVNRLVVETAPPTWTVTLRGGARKVGIDREAFAALVARYGSSVRVAGHTYRGVPLYRLVGRVDGGGSAFDVRRAQKGYSIDLSNGRRHVRISSKLIAGRPANVLVACQRDGEELSGSTAPLVFTGKVPSAKRLSALTSITLLK